MSVGWYVHHQGAGHLQRFRTVRAHLPGLTGLSSLPRPADVPASEWIELALDAPAPPGADERAGGTLHWAPLHHDGLRERMASIAGWIVRERPAALVVDVSVEVATLARLMGVPVVWIGQRGHRVDLPHRTVYAFSQVIVPWTAAVRGHTTGLPAGTRFAGAFSRLDGRARTAPPGAGNVLLLLGRGGHAIGEREVAAARLATPGWAWRTMGVAAGGPAARLHDDDALWAELMDADVIVGSASTNVVAEVAGARRSFVCLAQSRPFDEQRDQADALAAAGLAEAPERWPDADQWEAVLSRAAGRDPGEWSILHDDNGAQRAAGFIAEVACASP